MVLLPIWAPVSVYIGPYAPPLVPRNRPLFNPKSRSHNSRSNTNHLFIRKPSLVIASKLRSILNDITRRFFAPRRTTIVDINYKAQNDRVHEKYSMSITKGESLIEWSLRTLTER
jgi:hypothetical protein